jgi:hypothetical protein
MVSKIYYVVRHDFKNQKDLSGRSSLQSAHATLDLANDEARDLLQEITEAENDDDRKLAQIEQDGLQGDGRYRGAVRLFRDDGQDTVDLCIVTVEETILNGGIVQVIWEPTRKPRRRMYGDGETLERGEDTEDELTESEEEGELDVEHVNNIAVENHANGLQPQQKQV